MGRRPLDLSEARWTVPTRELAHVLGISQSHVRDLVVDGMPKSARGSFHLPTCVQWWHTRRQEKAVELNTDLATRKAHLYDSQEQKNRIEIAETLSHLIPADEVSNWFSIVSQAFVDALDSIPTRFDAPPGDIARLEREISATRADLADSLRNVAQHLRINAGDPDTPTQ